MEACVHRDGAGWPSLPVRLGSARGALRVKCHTNMKTMLKIAVFAFLAIGASSHCYALRGIYSVSTPQAAQELGVSIRWGVVAPNQAGVWLAFAPRGKLARFNHGEWQVASAERQLVYAAWQPLHQTNDEVVLYFSADRDYVQKSALTLIVSVDPEYAEGYSFSAEVVLRVKRLSAGEADKYAWHHRGSRREPAVAKLFC